MSSDSDAGRAFATGAAASPAAALVPQEPTTSASKPRRTVNSSDSDSDRDARRGRALLGVGGSSGKHVESDGNDGDLSATGGTQGFADLGLSESSEDDSVGNDVGSRADPSASASAASAAAAAAAARSRAMRDMFGDSDRESDGDAGMYNEADGQEAAAAAAAADEAAVAARREAERVPIVLADLPRPSSSSEVYVAKLTKILGLQERCFDPETFDAEKEEEEQKMAQSVIRWRCKKDASGAVQRNADGTPALETNTRLVKWSDGSMQLMVGSDLFNVVVQPNDRSFLFVQHKPEIASSSTCLECQGRLPRKVTFQPQLQSQLHQNMALMIRSQAAAAQRGRVTVDATAPIKDPQWVKNQRIREKEELQKHERRRRSNYDKYGGSRGSGGRRAAGMDSRFLEEEDADNYDTIGARAIKEDVRRGRYDQQSDDDSDEGGNVSALLRAKQSKQPAARSRQQQEGGGGSGGASGSGKRRKRQPRETVRGGKRGKRVKAAAANEAGEDDDDDEGQADEDEEEEAASGDSDEDEPDFVDSEEEDEPEPGESSSDDTGAGRGSNRARGKRSSGSGKAALGQSAAGDVSEGAGGASAGGAAAARGGGEDAAAALAGGESEEEGAASMDRNRQLKRSRRTVVQDSDSE